MPAILASISVALIGLNAWVISIDGFGSPLGVVNTFLAGANLVNLYNSLRWR